MGRGGNGSTANWEEEDVLELDWLMKLPEEDGETTAVNQVMSIVSAPRFQYLLGKGIPVWGSMVTVILRVKELWWPVGKEMLRFL